MIYIKYTLMKNLNLLFALCLLFTVQSYTFASEDEDFINQQRKSFEELTPQQVEAKRQEILTMSNQTLERLYKEHPEAKEEIKNAYGYGAFEGHGANLVLYVAGKGRGVVFDNKTKKTFL